MAAIKANVSLKIGPFFGVPVNVLGAIEDEKKETSLNTLCLGDVDVNKDGVVSHVDAHAPARCRQDLKCEECGNNNKDTFKKGQDRGDGTYAIVDAEAVAAAIATSEDVQKTLTLTTHPIEQVAEQTLPNGKVYYLEPGKGGAAGYPLIVEAVKQRPNVAFCTVWASRSVPAMYRLGVYRDALTITQLAWPASVKAAPANPGGAKEEEVKMALVLVDQLCSDFDPDTFRDTRTETLRAFIAAAEGVEGAATPETAVVTPKVTSMMDMLAAAVAASGAPEKAEAPKPKAKPRKKVSA